MRNTLSVEKFDKRAQAVFKKMNAQRFHASSKVHLDEKCIEIWRTTAISQFDANGIPPPMLRPDNVYVRVNVCARFAGNPHESPRTTAQSLRASSHPIPMKHRFPIGTQYWSRGKHPRLCTVVALLTTKDEDGRVVSIRYTTQHEFLGQKVDNHDVVDPTIAMGLLPEYQHLLTDSATDAPATASPREHTVHTPGRLHFRENGGANSYALLDENGRWWMSLLMNGEQVTESQRANLARMAAAWNACDGISTEKLEAFADEPK